MRPDLLVHVPSGNIMIWNKQLHIKVRTYTRTQVHTDVHTHTLLLSIVLNWPCSVWTMCDPLYLCYQLSVPMWYELNLCPCVCVSESVSVHLHAFMCVFIFIYLRPLPSRLCSPLNFLYSFFSGVLVCPKHKHWPDVADQSWEDDDEEVDFGCMPEQRMKREMIKVKLIFRAFQLNEKLFKRFSFD